MFPPDEMSVVAGMRAVIDEYQPDVILLAAGRVLIGGAGGYQPFDHTPRIWANVVKMIYSIVAAPRV